MKAILVCEGSYEETLEFRDRQHLEDFSDGFASGAGHYGAGSFGVYSLEDADDPDLDPEIIDLIRTHCPHE